MARVLLAIYDPSQPSPHGSYWAWRSPQLSLELLERFYFDKSGVFRPEDIRQLAEDDVWGGATRLEQQWLCLCRYYNGGRDLRGRPGRFLLAVALAPMSDVVGCDVSPLFHNEIFDWIAKNATLCPLPEPPVLEQDIALQRARPDPVQIARVLKELHVEYRGSGAVRLAMSTAIALPGDRPWNCLLRETADETIAIVERHDVDDRQPVSDDADKQAGRIHPPTVETPTIGSMDDVQYGAHGVESRRARGTPKGNFAPTPGRQALAAAVVSVVAFVKRHADHAHVRRGFALSLVAVLILAGVVGLWLTSVGISIRTLPHSNQRFSERPPAEDGFLSRIDKFLSDFGESLGMREPAEETPCPSCARLRTILIVGAAITLPALAVMGYVLIRRRQARNVPQ